MRSWIPSLCVVVGLLSGSVAAAQPQDVAAGEDLVAWQTLEHRALAGDEAVIAYRQFMLQYTTSPLAEAAWDRLVAIGADASWTDDPTVLAVVADVRSRWEAHQRQLLKQSSTRVVSIDLRDADDDAAAARDTGR